LSDVGNWFFIVELLTPNVEHVAVTAPIGCSVDVQVVLSTRDFLGSSVSQEADFPFATGHLMPVAGGIDHALAIVLHGIPPVVTG
jgi:hypothetical protein